MNSKEFTLCSGSFEWGVYHKFYLGKTEMAIYMFIYALVFPYIFLLVDCFEWALTDDIEQQRVHSVLWQFQMGVLSQVLPR